MPFTGMTGVSTTFAPSQRVASVTAKAPPRSLVCDRDNVGSGAPVSGAGVGSRESGGMGRGRSTGVQYAAPRATPHPTAGAQEARVSRSSLKFGGTRRTAQEWR